jgi:uncharacterized membrane protein
MFNFLKNTIFRGLVVLIPVVILFITIRELLQIMVQMATPIADLFPADTFDHAKETEIIAALLVAGSAFLVGLLAMARPTQLAGKWLEDRTLNLLPMYRMLKSFIAAFLSIEGEESFKPALLNNEDGSREPCYLIEDRGYDQVVIMKPWTPTPFAGSLLIVRKSQIEILPLSLDEFSLSLTHFGLGLVDQVAEHSRAGAGESHE